MGEEYEEMVSPGASLSAAERTATKSSAATNGFTLDTSGYVLLARPTRHRGGVARRWPDLDAFTQGYVEAMWLAAYHDGQFATAMKAGRRDMRLPGFSDLAPETLAAILKDCAAWLELYPETTDGARFWELRNLQLVERPDFPPLTATLGDDGKVYLRETADGRP